MIMGMDTVCPHDSDVTGIQLGELSQMAMLARWRRIFPGQQLIVAAMAHEETKGLVAQAEKFLATLKEAPAESPNN